MGTLGRREGGRERERDRREENHSNRGREGSMRGPRRDPWGTPPSIGW